MRVSSMFKVQIFEVLSLNRVKCNIIGFIGFTVHLVVHLLLIENFKGFFTPLTPLCLCLINYSEFQDIILGKEI